MTTEKPFCNFGLSREVASTTALTTFPTRPGEAEFRRNHPLPISVKIQQGGECCSVIALTSDGTRRSNVTLGTALALHQAGVHAVVDGGRQTEVSCSSKTAKSQTAMP